MSYKRRNIMVTSLLAGLVLTALFSNGCTSAGTSTTTGTNLNANSSTAASANANITPETSGAAPLEAREPNQYSVTTTITIQPTGNAPQANIPPLQFLFARMGTDRRVSFKLPDPVGEVIYLEKSPLKYLIFPARNQYVELDPNELGFQLGAVMSPTSIVARLKERAQYEQIGTAPVNGRTAIKYRFRAAADTHTKVGTAQADSIVYVDQETGLPLRSEIETSSSSGAGARITTSAESLQLAPEPSLFEVPTNMKKVTSAELKQQVQSFVGTIRAFAGYLREQAAASAPAGSQP
jgi:outer membrane lipoprotein-sorting protein